MINIMYNNHFLLQYMRKTLQQNTTFSKLQPLTYQEKFNFCTVVMLSIYFGGAVLLLSKDIACCQDAFSQGYVY